VVIGFLSHEGTKGTKVFLGWHGCGFLSTDDADFLGGIARVYLTTEYTEHTERHSSAVSREGAKTRRLEGECPHEPPGRAMEGECPHEPPSTARKDGFSLKRAVEPSTLFGFWFQGFMVSSKSGSGSLSGSIV
jgi:hypothetical protein